MRPFLLPFQHEPRALAVIAPGRPNLVYGELNNHLARIAAQLHHYGLGAEDRVVLVTPNGPEAATAFLAIASVAQCAPLNPGYRDAEFDYYLKDLRPRLVIHTDDTPVRAAAAALGIATARMVIDPAQPAGIFSLPELPDAQGDPAVEPPGIALLLHTSGTTSRPKLVPLTWANLLESSSNIQRTLQLTAADRCLNVMPLFHIHGLVAALLATLRAGGSIVCTPGLIAPSFFDWIDAFSPTWYTAVPTMHQSILARAPRHPESIARSQLRLVRSSSAPLPIAVMRELETTFGVPVIEAYGMTEAAHQMASNQLPPAVRKPGSVGCAAGPDLAVLDADGRLLAAGNEGHVCVRGTNITPGYVDNDAANLEAFRHGWFYTGDLGRMDDDGHLFLTGRSKEILNRGGEKISPREIDEVLIEHAAVRQCLTFALPDSQLGEEVGVVVVLRALFNGDLGWAEIGYDVEMLIVPGDHERMFMNGNAAVLAERLLARIDAMRAC